MMSESVPHVHVHAREPPLDQLVQEPVLIGWSDPTNGQYQHVGCLDAAGQPNRGRLVMWIGRAAAGNGQHLLISFHIPFSTRSTLHRSKKDMFLVVPVERLRIDLRRVEARSLPDGTLFQLRGTSPLELREGLVRARFSLGLPAYIVMPKLRRPLAKPLTGVPGRLMSCMRSLAAVQEFDVYLSRGGVELELQAIRSILNQDVVGTPELDVHATYKGGFGGGKNLWQSYPCEEDGNLPWNPLVDDEPASYEKAAMREDVPTSPSAILKETRLRLRKKPTPDESSDGLAWRVRPSPEIELVRPTNTEPKRLPVTYSHKRKVSEAISDYEEQHLGKRDNGATTQEKVKPTQEKVKPAPAAIRTISASHQDPAGTQAYRHISNPAPHRDTTGGNNPSITTAERNIEPSAARRATAATARTPPPDPPAHTTPYYRRRASSPPALPPSPPDHDAAPPLHLRAAVLDCLRARAGTAAASQPPSDLSPLHTPHLFLELSEFLAAATRLDPRAHDTHREPLLALGAAARSGDVAAFDAAMGMCQREVVREAWGAGQELLGECFVLLDWLNGSVCRVAGTLMLGVLVGLGDVGEVHWGSEEWTGELARVRATAFWAFG